MAVAPVWLLPPSALDSRSDTIEDNNWATIIEWLGKQETESVFYVALGSKKNVTDGPLKFFIKGGLIDE